MRTIINPTSQSTIQPYCVAALMLASVLTIACKGDQAKAAPPAAPQVLVTSVERRDVPIVIELVGQTKGCLLYTSPSPRDRQKSRMPSSA